MKSSMEIVILGLSITSSWGNGHATTYRGLVRELVERGHRVTFLERDVPWYASNRDLANPPYGETHLYSSQDELRDRFGGTVAKADLVIIGSYVPDGIAVGTWSAKTVSGVLAFYDIDTPITLARLHRGACDYLTPELIPRYDLYLSFAGGPVLKQLERQYGSPMARPFYCSVDPSLYFPEESERNVDLGYMGTYSPDRQPPLEKLLLNPARQWRKGAFEVAGPQYPDTIEWPSNVHRVEHLPPAKHRTFYNQQRFTLNITRADMVQTGFSPSVRLFEAAACATPVISDWWVGLDAFFEPGTEILLSGSAGETLEHLCRLPPEKARRIGERAREKVLRFHTAAHRALELERYVGEVWSAPGKNRYVGPGMDLVAGVPRDANEGRDDEGNA